MIPALFTKTRGSPRSARIPLNKVSTLCASVTLSTRPTPPCSASAAPIASAPDWLVAVPTTSSPCSASAAAIAAPIPRLAPVTRAIFRAVSVIMLYSFHLAAARSASGSSKAAHAASASIRFNNPVSTLPGPHSTNRPHPAWSKVMTH